MKSLAIVFAALVCAFALVGNAEAAVLRVVIVETSDSATYLKELDKIRAANKRLGNPDAIRVWRARFSGADAGSIAVAIEYADWAAFAASDAKSAADAEVQAIIKGLDNIRKIVSDSMYQELK